jgi:hypothetical protein
VLTGEALLGQLSGVTENRLLENSSGALQPKYGGVCRNKKMDFVDRVSFSNCASSEDHAARTDDAYLATGYVVFFDWAAPR